MAKVKLTKSVIDDLPVPDKGRVTYWDTELKGFCIRLSRTSKTYYAKKRIAGRPQWVKIGEHGPLTPDKARNEALKILSELIKGVDVNKKKAQERVRGITLKEAMDDYFMAKPFLREGTKRTYLCILNKWLPDWMEKPLEEIDKNDTSKRHLKIAKERSPVMANNVMRTFRAIHNHAKEISEGMLPESPTVRLTQTRQWFPIERRQTFIAESDLDNWYAALVQFSNPVACDALLALLFTGCREQEILSLRWDDVNMRGKTFTIRSEVSKNHRSHTVPMSKMVFEIFNRRLSLRENEWVFPSHGSKGHLIELKRAVQYVIETSKVSFCIHDLRRTFATIAEQEVSYAVLKRLMNHSTRNDVTAGYLVLPTEQLREPMEKISSRIQKAFNAKKKSTVRGKVIPIRKNNVGENSHH